MSRVAGFFVLFIVLVSALFLWKPAVPAKPGSTTKAQPADLRLPSTMATQDYQRLLYKWLMTRKYKALNWRSDKTVRDTGAYINGQYFGTHPAVRIHYSPEVIAWLENGRRGEIADGAMIVKEMFSPPAVFYQQMSGHPKLAASADYENFVDSMVTAWTVMVRDKEGSKDGWYWANPSAGSYTPSSPGEKKPDQPPVQETLAKAIDNQLDHLNKAPESEFGAPCLRCHASADSHFTFSDLDNIKGLSASKEPLRFLVDNSWRRAGFFDDYPLAFYKFDPYVQQHFMLPDELRPNNGAPDSASIVNSAHGENASVDEVEPVASQPLPEADKLFLETFKFSTAINKNRVRKFPSQWMDQVLPASHQTQAFISSDNCLGCHGGLSGAPNGPVMFAANKEGSAGGYNLSEYGEWRWSPMGLAGRDPIFHAQLESEMKLLERDSKQQPTPLQASLEKTSEVVTNTCLSCHGAMGQRQLKIDAQKSASEGGGAKLNANFSTEYFYLKKQLTDAAPPSADAEYEPYGALARDGVSCAICHHIDKPSESMVQGWSPPTAWLTDPTQKLLAYTLFHNNTGRFVQGPADQFFGPFEEVAELPMDRVLGVTPVHNEFIQDSQLCGTCHTINLPNIGATKPANPVLNQATIPEFEGYQHSIEQATFLEWQNSVFAQNPNGENSRFQSCQDCHMPGGFTSLDGSVKLNQVTTQIATIQDIDYPEASNRLPNNELTVPLRSDYKRHEHVGLNVFLLEMFDQFPQILGVDKSDYMTGVKNGVELAKENMVRQARLNTAGISVDSVAVKDKKLTAKVTVTNRTGHRFPSGVAFRRAFIEFVVLEGDKEIWGSGRTNSVGVIVGGENKPLPTEFLPDSDTYQPHYTKIDQQNQVQIYEELNQNAQGAFTTSFIHRVEAIKDNRLLPDGWRQSGQFAASGELLLEFMAATDPHGVGQDPDYRDQGPGFQGKDRLTYEVVLPKGVDLNNLSVRATLYSQSIPPSWLHQRFSTAPDGDATQRLYYLASHLNVQDTHIKDWKLKLVADRKPVIQP